MERVWIWVLVFCASALLASPSFTQEVAPPKTIAFIVGIQSYNDPDLNQLQFTAKDAEDVFERLKAVTNLDLARSRLLLADPEAPEEADATDPDWMIRKRHLGLQELQDELARFLESIENDDTVTFYLGGHGTVQADRHLLFLPSDYSRRPQMRYWRYSTIIDDIRGQIDARNLRNVSVVFFANMCGAGTAAGEMSADDDLDHDFVEDWLARNTVGFDRFALFPASAPNRNTFERADLGRSIFAHHLLEGMRGAAAETGVITAGSLFSYLDANMPEDLPKDPAVFDPQIPIGVTRDIEARALYLNGLALLSDALETDDPLYWRLAERNLAEALNYSGDGRLGAMAALMLAQVRVAEGGNSAELANILAPIAGSAANDPELRSAAKRLVEVAELASSEPFLALLVTSSSGDSSGSELWQDFLQSLPGHIATKAIHFDTFGEEQNRGQLILKALVEMRREQNGEGGPPHLVLVYSGIASDGSAGSRFPFSTDEYVTFLSQWGGEATLIYDAPFGGFLKEAYEQDLLGDIALVLAAQEKNGMAFSEPVSQPPGGDGSGMGTTSLLVGMLRAGISDVESWERFQLYRERFAELTKPDPESWVVGTPVTLRRNDTNSPIFLEAAQFRQQAKTSLAPVRRMASLVATGCDLRVRCERFVSGPVETGAEDNPTAALGLLSLGDQVAPEAVYDLLKSAALLDFSGDPTGAYKMYQRFLDLHEEVHREVGGEAPADEDDLRAAAQRSLERLSQRVRDRIDGLEGKMTRRVHLLHASVPDYASPLVPDLVGPSADLAAWETTLKASRIWGRLEMGETETPLVATRIDTSSRVRFLASLEEALGQADREDLVIFVFSGRAIEIDGERYLATADSLSAAEIAVDARLGGSVSLERYDGADAPVLPPWGGIRPGVEWFVSLAEVADRARDHWFLGIYDTQFTPPIFDTGRTDSILDKHLDSVRPSASEPSATVPTESALERFVAVSGDARNHVHFWWEGRLTERLHPPPDCPVEEIRGVRSPMSAALLAVLSEQPYGTYRDWVERAQEHACLGPSAAFGLVAQGSVDLPRFASANAATQIPFFLSARERRDVNLHLSEHVTATASRSGDHPLVDLGRAAILVALTEFTRSSPAPAGQANWLDEALRVLRPLLQSKKVKEHGLEQDVLDLFTRALMLNGDHNLARDALLDAPASQLTSATLQMRLIELTEAALLQSPTTILDLTREKLMQLERVGVVAGLPVSDRLKKISSDFDAPRRNYRISIEPEGLVDNRRASKPFLR